MDEKVKQAETIKLNKVKSILVTQPKPETEKSPYFEKLAKNPDPNTANLDLLQYSHFVINDSTNKILKCRNILQNIFDNFLLEDKDET